MSRKFTKYPQGYVKATSTVNNSLSTLREVLQQYAQSHETTKYGVWKIKHLDFDWATGDTWDLYFKNKSILSLLNGRLGYAYIGKSPISIEDYANIQDVILEVFPDIIPLDVSALPARYSVLMGFNTKQLWVYDEEADTYIDPPADVLSALPADDDAAAVELDRIANEENPDWLHDQDYTYDAEDTNI